MNLFYSVLTSSAVVLTVWGSALIQPKTAQAALQKSTTVDIQAVAEPAIKATQPPAPAAAMPASIAGITLRLKLSEVTTVWQTFNQAQALHNRLKAQPENVYVLYRQFSGDFQQADITIGYDAKMLSGADNSIQLDPGRYTTLLPSGKYNEHQLLQAWQKINYLKTPHSVVEIHRLNPAGEAKSTQMLVSYQ
ncbi:lipase chaperone [Thalassomonas viridans]|uniref:Lipase chaperone n=1 Tax=Thalassomonas viridans TaxID=137584 RepID=A0AAF0CBG6_9GAMM|nr:lipase chaperone [Thalassomonas viridans]WDE07411.1 lipase chaperone [Thalassomonas viridans]